MNIAARVVRGAPVDMPQDEIRPPVETVASRAEFERWYWPVAKLHEFCVRLELPRAGTKKELRERVALAFDGKAPTLGRSRRRSTENWRTKMLSVDTIITDDVAFGPNLRAFFKGLIGRTFVCHSDFMKWVRNNVGATLGDAVTAWHSLEERKADPAFRREIAASNNFLQYLRDVRDENPGLSLEEAKRCWDAKKLRPARAGRVVYEAADLRFLETPDA